MPVHVIDRPIEALCGGSQWFVEDAEKLVTLTAIAMVGRARQAGNILDGTEQGPIIASAALKVRLKRALILEEGAQTWHRDGLLFETICWIVARMGAGADEVISDPHRRATQQGADTVKVVFDSGRRSLQNVTVYEQKCSENPRAKFRDEVLPAFSDWITGTRDDELLQIAIGLLDRYNLTDEESNDAYARLALAPRPLMFRAALTVAPAEFSEAACKAVFKDYDELTVDVTARFGNTFPQADMRGWFKEFAGLVWAKIETFDV